MDDKKFVHDGTEVILTGRVAYRAARGGRTVEKNKRPKLVEIEPANKVSISANNKRWVSADELYEIEGSDITLTE